MKQCFHDWVKPVHPFEKVDAWHSPFYGQVLERLRSNIQPDTEAGEAPEIPVYEKNRGLGSSSDVDFWTSRPVWPVEHSHLNYLVADTRQWEQSASYFVDAHALVRAFVRNALNSSFPGSANSTTVSSCSSSGGRHNRQPRMIRVFDLVLASWSTSLSAG